ncbi:sulfur carrier protein ThiS [Pseudodesulfovibrio sp. F-1]|uniref:Sulfur carrier protein ThiS n=1 Tax=Pseudodesulfovibrio alkaliphilus TaxID=2661613 RepID=A0A7K1KLB9_9BACT|nr:sulfur carrier protein ThiS [Pseudodesulfovibrio alkaliphilus]MUM76874.1 sulfur carrier protein ThiS [Pseudodesulfovibrio alkaliphilus]
MIVVVNGTRREIDRGATLLGLLEGLGINPDTVVVERNQEIVPSVAFAAVVLNEGDHLEVLRFVGGG